MSDLSGWRIGFIGLGLMGKPMARNLKAAGAALVVHNRSEGPVRELAAEGMSGGGSPRGVAEQVDAVVTMLTDTPAVEAVLMGENGVVEGLRPGSLVIDMGTTTLMKTKEFAFAVEAKGGQYVDAPVSGGTIGAVNGTLTIMAGGEASAFNRVKPILDALGARVTHVGDVGAGQVAKAANQVIVGLTIGAVAEALTLARKAGVDPAKVCEALQGGFADSRVLEVHGGRMTAGTFTPGAKATTQRKDMQQALDLAQVLSVELPATALNRQLYDKLIAAGNGELDHAALIKAIDPTA